MKFRGHTLDLLGAILLAVLAMTPLPAWSTRNSFDSQIANFDKVSASLCRGAKPSPSGIQHLHESGIKTIVDLRRNDSDSQNERKLAKCYGLNYFHLPMGYASPSATTILTFLDVVCNPKYQPVFVHCRQGADRTGTLVGIYRLLVQGWSWDETYKDMRNHNFKPWLVGLKNTVATFQYGLSSQNSNLSPPLVTIRHTVEAVIKSEHDRLLAGGYRHPGS